MKKFFTYFLLFLGYIAVSSAQKDTIKIIAIGNSFADDAIIQYLWPIANADGTPMICANMYIGGCTMKRHSDNIKMGKTDYIYRKVVEGKEVDVKNVSLDYGLRDEDWDFVMLQNGQGQYGLYDTYFPYINTVMAYAKRHVNNPKMKFVMQQVWAFPNQTVRKSYLDYYGSSKDMYATITKTMAELKENLALYAVSPTGTAIENVRCTYVQENVTRDGFHLNKYIGRYTAGCAMYETLTGRSCVGNTYRPDHITEERIHIAQQAAHAAVLNPNQSTNLHIDIRTPNYDEDKIPAYTLPDPLIKSNGKKVKSKKDWITERRPELLSLFETEMFGKAPRRPSDMHFKVLNTDANALGGLATRKEVAIYFTKGTKHCMTLLIYIPNSNKKGAPAFLGINFKGNHGICSDSMITIPDNILRYGIYDNLKRGAAASRWPVETILKRGYAIATFYRGDVDPDFDDGFANGVHPIFYKKGQTYPEADEWGTIAAWTWGLSRALDYLETDPCINANKVTVFGHSRLGKTALWAGATDERFAAVISNCSGCGGAALSRRKIGETIETINRHFNNWFCDNFKKYNENEDKLPFDQHELLALIAPRPLYVASATEDRWADPQGEYLSAKEASKVYRLFGKKGLEDGTISYHRRKGKHDITLEDWEHYLDFADKFVK